MTISEKQTLVVSLIIFIITPILGILFLTIFLVGSNRKSHILYALFLLISIYLGLINSTKLPGLGDQQMYYEAFKLVPHRTLWQNLTGIYGIYVDSTTKEMGFGLLNIVGYYISFGNYPLFIVYFTTGLYMLLFISIEKWFRYIKVQKENIYIISAVLVVAFFTQYFNLTIHLQRQVIASAVIIYAIINMVTSGKIPWITILIALSLHTSVGIFIPIFILFKFSPKISLIYILLYILLIDLAIGTIGYSAKALLNSIGGQVYALERIEQIGVAGREDRMSDSLLLMVSLPLTIISLINLYKYRGQEHKNEMYLFIFYLFIMSFSFITPNNTMQYRYFMMSYAFIPFIIPLTSRKGTYMQKVYLTLLPLLLMIRFYYTFEDIVFTYAPIEKVMTSNIFTLFNYNNIP